MGSGAAPARRPLPAYKVALAAVDSRLSPADAASYRAVIRRTARLASLLPASRAAVLRSQLAQAAAIAPKLTSPRAAAIFGQLAANDDWFSHRGSPAPMTDITDADGVVYRYFAGHGFEFHPLASFGALNAAVATRNVAATARLATALAARGVPEAGGARVFEYYFDYGGGRAPWTSGFAQAVAAQAFARAAAVDTGDSSVLLGAARSAYRAIPGRLERQTGFGPWIKLYSFNRAVVLNAQLQSAISLADYAKATGDTRAEALGDGAPERRAPRAAALQQRLLVLLPAPRRPLAGQLPGLRRPAAPDALQARRPLRLGGGEVRGLRDDPAGVQARKRGCRLGQLLGLETLDRAGLRARRLAEDLRRGRLAHGLVRPAEPGGDLPGDDPRHRLEGELGLGRRAADRARLQPAQKKHKAKRTVASAADATLPALVAGAGLEQPTQAAAAAAAGYGAVRMTLVWPDGAATPDPGAIAALNRLPAGTNLVLELYVAAWPPDATALAAYAASVAAQVPALHDLVVGPGPSTASVPAYTAALAATYAAVKTAAPLVRVDGALDGALTPKATLTALAAAGAKMDELAFTPAAAAGKGLWPVASIPTLVTALGASLPGPPVIVDGLSADTFARALTASACRAPIVEVILTRLSDSTDALSQAAAAAQAPDRGCKPVATPAPTPTPSPTPAPGRHRHPRCRRLRPRHRFPRPRLPRRRRR